MMISPQVFSQNSIQASVLLGEFIHAITILGKGGDDKWHADQSAV
jgi:hypothetical protein